LDFAKQFLERRSKYKSLQRAQKAHNDDMCKPAPAITPSANDYADSKVLSEYFFNIVLIKPFLRTNKKRLKRIR